MSDYQAAEIIQQLAEKVKTAFNSKTALKIVGNQSKSFYGNPVSGEPLEVTELTGIINYHPSELVITAYAGTNLNEIISVLKQQGQMLAFEPPNFAEKATLGGTIACGFSGPRRAFTGAARDYILGCKIINGKGEVLKFGGEVIKNVAGYDASRLMCGALGTLGVLLEVSLKVVPIPEHEQTQIFELENTRAIEFINQLGTQTYPLSANCIYNNKLYIRLSGAEVTVINTIQSIGGDKLGNDSDFWQSVREHQHEFFEPSKDLWRISVPQTSTNLNTEGDELIEWYGGLRWLHTTENAIKIHEAAIAQGGHAILYKTNTPNEHIVRFSPLERSLKQLHINIKNAFDPHNILNPKKLYTDI